MHYGYVRTKYGYRSPICGSTPICTQLGHTQLQQQFDLGGIALIGGYSSQIEYTGDYGPYLVPQTSFEWNDALTWVKGKHTLKVGGNIIRRQLNLFRPNAGKGYFNLCGNGGRWQRERATARTKYPISSRASFVQYQDGVPFGMVGTRSWENGFFAQDDWRVTKRLTLNLGMRWDIFTSP